MTTAEAIIIAACIWSAVSVVLSLYGWYIVYPWQKRKEWEISKQCRDPNPWYREPTKEEKEPRDGKA